MMGPVFLKVLAVGFILLFLLTCRTHGELGAGSIAYIEFGQYGGFAGAYHEYRLFPDGRLMYRNEINGPLNRLTDAPSDKTKACFKTAQEIMEIQSMNKPGNLTNFIKLSDGEKIISEMVWAEGLKSNETLLQLNQMLRDLVLNNHPVM